MNCKEFQERISAAVDRCLERQEMDGFEEHAHLCSPCKREYVNELSTKEILQRHARMVSTPVDVQVSLGRQIDREAGESGGVQYSLVSRWRAPAVRAVLALACTAVLVVLILGRSQRPQDTPPFTTASPESNNVVKQSIDNYHRFLRGEIVPQAGSDDSLKLQNFFKGKTSFPVHIPRIQQCALIGGVVNEHNGTGLAHVLYRTGNDMIYVCQACWETVQEGKVLEIAPEAKTALLATGWYTPRPSGNDAVVVWTRDRTLCIAVSHMKFDRLLASVRSGADSAPDAH